jgi:hypothetical protein
VTPSYLTMWGTLILMALGAVGAVSLHGNPMTAIRDAYPSDPDRQAALRHCGRINDGFSRFSESDRETCYRIWLPGSARGPNIAVER